MIWPRVPEAAMVPVASAGEYLWRIITGNEIRPMATTVAPTMPVVAASSAPTKYDGDAEPAGYGPEKLCHGDQQIFRDARSLQHDAHEYEQRYGNERIALDLPVDSAEIRDAGGQPVDRTSLGEVGVHIAREHPAAQGPPHRW